MATHAEKHAKIITRSEQPLNLEPPIELIRQNFTTPTELFYVRNHGSIPEIDAVEYRLSVAGMVQQELHLSMDEICENFSKSTVTVTLQCAGNRRQGLIKPLA